MTTTTRITRQYLEHKTKSDLAQMYLDLLEEDVELENAAKLAVEWEQEYRTINNLGSKAPDCFVHLKKVLGLLPEEPAVSPPAGPITRLTADINSCGTWCPCCGAHLRGPEPATSEVSYADIDKLRSTED
jgi:hypothetical protein